jgi:hypothetical protein
MIKQITTIAALSMTALTMQAQETIPSLIEQDTTLMAGTDYTLSGVTYVMPGATLTIEAGVTVYAAVDGSEPATLIVANGAMIHAVGTPERPIVFTADDALNTALDHNDVGLWSGIIILGDASINAGSGDEPSGEGVVLTNGIECLDAIGRHGLDTSVENGLLTYGGTNDAHSAGRMEYVSIRHTGFSISGIPGDEIQGLTLGGVGSGTVFENIEIFVSDDDGIEIFGGTANLRNIVIAYAEDDSLDLDQGYRGNVQNLIIIQVAFTDIFGEARNGDHGGEWDGADTPQTNDPRSAFKIANASIIQTGVNDGENDDVFNFKAAAIGQVWNSAVLTNFEQWFKIDNEPDNNIIQDAFLSGDSAFYGLMTWNGGLNTAYTSDVVSLSETEMDFVSLLTAEAAKNSVQDHGITVSVDEAGKASVSYPASGPLYDAANVVTIPELPFLVAHDYVGAFGPNENWAAWTFSAEMGYLNVPGTVQTATFGWVYAPNGLSSSWIYQWSSETWIYMGARANDGSRWVYLP